MLRRVIESLHRHRGQSTSHNRPLLSEHPQGALQQDSAALYLDLMKLCLTDRIYGDDDPGWNPLDDQLDSLIRFRGAPEGTNWPSHAHTMVGSARLENIQTCVESVLADVVPGDLIQTGVWRGGATIFMRAILKAYNATDRCVWVADSFKGLPPPEPEKYPADEGLDLTTYPKLAVSLKTVRDNFAKYGLLDDQVRFVEGWFEDTLPPKGLKQLAVLRLDGDLYGSTWVALERLYPKLSPGGYTIIDDFGAIEACRKAVHDFRDKFGITEPMQRIDYSGIFWRRRGKSIPIRWLRLVDRCRGVFWCPSANSCAVTSRNHRPPRLMRQPA